LEQNFQKDIDTIANLPVVPTILDVVCRTTGMGFAAVARVTPDRWIACGVKDEIGFGLKPGGELNVETTICHEIRQSGEPVIINHAAEDHNYANHHTPLQYGFRSYISMPIVLRDGTFFGTLCAIDQKPAQLNNPQIIGMFRLFADLIAFHLDASTNVETTKADLIHAQQTAVLREEFIAVLGHDLRNPLASIVAGLRLLMKEVQSEKARSIALMMQASVDRMAGLIDNVMDFARGRLGGGWHLNLADEMLPPVLDHVVDEMKAAHPDRAIDTQFALPRAVNCDRIRIAQLFSNLLGNALMHGAADRPVTVRAAMEGGVFELSVSNAGDEIPADALPRLFQPYVRGKDPQDQRGLGLGLYIAAEIAKAHGGTLTAASSRDETRFTFRMPLA
jgi:signal transduction histidine kinase